MPEQIDREAFATITSMGPVLAELRQLEGMLDTADNIYRQWPKEVKDRIVGRPRSVLEIDIIMQLASANTDERHEYLGRIQAAVTVCEEVIEDARRAVGVQMSDDDFELLIKLAAMIVGIGSKSKREINRFFDARVGNDTAYLIVEFLSTRPGSRRTRTEARMCHELSSDTVDLLHLGGRAAAVHPVELTIP